MATNSPCISVVRGDPQFSLHFRQETCFLRSSREKDLVRHAQSTQHKKTKQKKSQAINTKGISFKPASDPLQEKVN